jgi:hypothetical protein
VLVGVCAVVLLLAPRLATAVCTGDCNADDEVTVDEMLVGVGMALGNVPTSQCPAFDVNGDNQVFVDELLQAVNNALVGCPLEPIFPANYRDTFTEVRDCRFSTEHGGVMIRVLANSTAAQEYVDEVNPLPAGSIVIKEEFNAQDCSDLGTLVRWRAMRKEAPNFDPEDGDWHWQIVKPDRSVTDDTKTTCIGCHNRPACLARDRMCTENGPPAGPDPHLVLQQLPGALLSVSGTSASDVYAVGADKRDGLGPRVLHYDGQKWHRLNTEATGDLWWVSVTPIDGSFYMAGDGGLILQYDPTAGTFVRHTTPGTQLLYGIWGSAANNLWAVGGDPNNEDTGGVVWHYDGLEWTAQDLSGVVVDGLPTLYKVWGRSPNEVYAAGRRGVIIRFDGGNWTQLQVDSVRPLFTVHGNDTEVNAVGGFFDGVILELEGDAFADRTPPGTPQTGGVFPQMNGVFIPPDGRGVAVGREGAIAIRTNTGWELQQTNLNTIFDFHATWVDPEGGIWAVGGDLSVDLKNGILAYAGARTIGSEIVEPNPCVPSASTGGPTTVSFANDVVPIFDAVNGAGCLTASCHGEPFPSSNYVLTSYESVFGPGVEAKFFKTCNVVPGDPSASYLLEKLLPNPRAGVRMPNLRPPLSDAQIEIIRTWILEGAQNN